MIMFTLKTIRLLFFLSIFTLFFSCGPKSWPDDALNQLKQSGVLSEEIKLITSLSNISTDQYLESVLEVYKQNYPDYADFEKIAKNNPEQIKVLRIPCLKKYAGSDINSLWDFIEKVEGVINLKYHLPATFYSRYKDLMMIKIRNEFSNMDNFIDKLTSDDAYVTNFIMKCDTEAGEVINNELKIEQEKVAIEEQNMARLSNLFDENSYNNGSISFWNNTNKTVSLAIGYYYFGQKWKGWVSEGWWIITSGEKATINMPLNDYGNINGNFYYCAKEVGGLGWGWSGEDAFIVMDDNFKIPNGDKFETLSNSRKFHFLFEFKKVEIGRTSEFTINLNS